MDDKFWRNEEKKVQCIPLLFNPIQECSFILQAVIVRCELCCLMFQSESLAYNDLNEKYLNKNRVAHSFNFQEVLLNQKGTPGDDCECYMS